MTRKPIMIRVEEPIDVGAKAWVTSADGTEWEAVVTEVTDDGRVSVGFKLPIPGWEIYQYEREADQ